MDNAPPARSEGRCRFGIFEFDARTLELWKKGRPVGVRPQPLKLLALLVARPGQLLSRQEIQGVLWTDDTFVDFEQGVNHSIRELRAVLGDDAGSPRFIQTLPRRGYRFVATIEPMLPDEVAPDTVPADTALTSGTDAPLSAGAPIRLSVRWIAGMVAGVMGVAIAVSLALRPATSGVTGRALVLAVAPFSTSGSDRLDGIGIANAIAIRLGGQQTLPVRALHAPESSAERRSGATHIVAGEITKNGADVMVVTRLEDVAASTTLWSERIHIRADELFSLDNVIAERVVSALRLRLAAAEQERLRRRYTNNSAAYEEYVRGRAALVEYTPDGTRRAIQAFEDALGRDPRYALARAGLAMACADMYLRFAPAAEMEKWGERAETEARAALDLDPDLAEAYLARAAVARKREFDWNTTMEASRRALVLNPNLDQAHLFRAAAYYHLGYMDESLIEMENGRRLHGADVVEPLRIEALVALFSGRFAPAAVHLEEVSRLSSQTIGDTYLALAYYYSGSPRGRTMLESLATNSSASTSARASVALAGVLAAQGDADAARGLIERVLARPYRDHHVAYGLGAAYAQLGDAHRATQWLRIAADTGFPCLPFFERDPLLEPLRRRSEFPALLEYVRARRESSLSPISR